MVYESAAEPDLLGIGEHCFKCQRLDFLPLTCSDCKRVFCSAHFSSHACTSPNHNTNDNSQVILCPLCAKGVKVPPGSMSDPNVLMDRHMASADCDPSNYSRVHKKQKCPVQGCREKLTTVNSYTCQSCRTVCCLKHRFPEAHQCRRSGNTRNSRSGGRAQESFLASLKKIFS